MRVMRSISPGAAPCTSHCLQLCLTFRIAGVVLKIHSKSRSRNIKEQVWGSSAAIQLCPSQRGQPKHGDDGIVDHFMPQAIPYVPRK